MPLTCPACRAGRYHTAIEIKDHHPLAGHGYTREGGWSHPSAKTAHDADAITARLKQEELDKAQAQAHKHNQEPKQK